MDRKGTKKRNTHPDRSKKVRFHGNRHTIEQNTTFTSTSAEKLKRSGDAETCVNRNIAYCILNFLTVFSTISEYVICKDCQQDVQFTEASPRGLGFKIAIKCQCDVVKYIPSCPFIGNAYEINRRIVFAMRLLGIGFRGLQLFCNIMDFGTSMAINTYYACLENVHIASESIYNISLQRAVAQEKEKTAAKTGNAVHFTVSGDGTWKKRGFSSLFGVTSLIGLYSKKVIDTVVKSSFCQACNLWSSKKDTAEYYEWLEEHQENCNANHTGSAGKMEVDAVQEMFCRSEEKYGIKYTTYIGDGDSKTFKGILNIQPYGDDVIVQKKECVAHVEKRMGTRLRAAKKNNKNLGGRGKQKLTHKVINDLTTYYGLAIRRNSTCVEDMKEAIWATYYHKCSTDKNPQHDRCPPGPESWCKWRKAEAGGTLEAYRHNAPLDDAVANVIKPIYEDLSRDELLYRCLGANTQNNNESINSMIWTFSPKHIHSGKMIVDIAVYLAVCIFNDGFNNILKIMETMGIQIGPTAERFAASRDSCRISRSDLRASTSTKEARTAAREERAAREALYEAEEGVLYGPGIDD